MATIDFTDNVTLVPAAWLNDVDALVYQGVTAAALVGSDGTVGAPAYSFSGDTDSGLYRIGANNLGVAVNGAKVLDIATTGLTVVGAAKLTTTDTGPSASAFSIAGTVLSSKGTGNTYWSGYTSGATSEFGMLFGSNNTENDANIVWKKASNFLQIGANPPSATIHIVAAGSDMATFSSTGLAVTGTLSATGIIDASNGLKLTFYTPPASASTGTLGTCAYDANYFYVCTATDTWKRAAIAAW